MKSYKLSYIYSVDPPVVFTSDRTPEEIKYLLYYIRDEFEKIDDSFNLGHIEVVKILKDLYGCVINKDGNKLKIEKEFDIDDFNNCTQTEYEYYKKYYIANRQSLYKEDLIKKIWRAIQQSDISNIIRNHEIWIKENSFNDIAVLINSDSCTI